MNELSNYAGRIDDLFGQIIDLVRELPLEALNWRPLEKEKADSDAHEINSLAVMAVHVAGSARFWIVETVAGQPINRDRPAEFDATADDPTALLTILQDAQREIRDVFTHLDPAELDTIRELEDRSVPARWAVTHVIDHTALHLGHMQITYQLWNFRHELIINNE